MTSLAEQQLTIRELIKGRFAGTPDDPYLTRVAGSAGLAMIREIAIWWRAQNIEAGCIWTSLLLKRRGVFEQRVEVFFHRSLGSAFIEDTVEDFLSGFTHDADSLTAAVAAFELAVLKAKGGDDREFRITWDRPPERVFETLASGRSLPPADTRQRYETYVCHRIPGFVRCESFR